MALWRADDHWPKATVRAGFERALNFVFHDSRDLSAKIRQMPKSLSWKALHLRSLRIPVQRDGFRSRGSGAVLPHRGCVRRHVSGIYGGYAVLDAFGGFFREVNLLVHEVSFGAGPLDEKVNAACRHSSAREAVRVAAESNARALLLTHTYGSKRADALAYARSALSIPWNGRSREGCSLCNRARGEDIRQRQLVHTRESGG